MATADIQQFFFHQTKTHVADRIPRLVMTIDIQLQAAATFRFHAPDQVVQQKFSQAFALYAIVEINFIKFEIPAFIQFRIRSISHGVAFKIKKEECLTGIKLGLQGLRRYKKDPSYNLSDSAGTICS